MTRISTKRKLLDLLDELDKLTRLCLETLTNKEEDANPDIIMKLLFEKYQEYENVRCEAEKQLEIQQKIDIVIENNHKLDGIIREFQEHMKTSETLLSTVLYYGRQKMDSIQKAIKHPLDPAEVVAYSHRLSANHGIMSPENWQAGDPRRPYPTDEEMRRGFLGHLNENGQFRSSVLEALQESLNKCTVSSGTSGNPVSVPVTSVFHSTIPGSTGTSTVNSSPRNQGVSHSHSSSVTPHTAIAPPQSHSSGSGNINNMQPTVSNTLVSAGSTPGSSFMLPGVNVVTSPVIVNNNATVQSHRSTTTAQSSSSNHLPGVSATTTTSQHSSLYGSTLHSLLSSNAPPPAIPGTLPTTYPNRSMTNSTNRSTPISHPVVVQHREEVDVISTDSSSSYSENEA